MLLQQLVAYAQNSGELPSMHSRKNVRYVIQLDESGHFLQCLDRSTKEQKNGPEMLGPDYKRGNIIIAKPFFDDGQYTLGKVDPKKADDPKKKEHAQKYHEQYTLAIRNLAATINAPSVKAVDSFLQHYDLFGEPQLADVDVTAVFTFEVNGIFPVLLPAIQQNWVSKTDDSATSEEDLPTLRCISCGEIRPALKRHRIPIKGIPDGQATGMTFISANNDAFESYGLENSLIAPTCKPCSEQISNAFNALLKDQKTHINIGSTAYIFWTKNSDFSFGSLITDPDESELQTLFRSAYTGKAGTETTADENAFYAAALSASGARVVVRDWLETTVTKVKENLRTYFQLQSIVDESGGKLLWFNLWRLTNSVTNSKSKVEKPSPLTTQALMRLALQGGILPQWILYQVVRRLRAEQKVKSEHAALIKMVLLSQNIGKDTQYMAQLEDDISEPAYVCGRLLAVIESIQREALGDVNATVTDRFYGTASSAPASVFSRLLRGAQDHLSRLRKDRPGTYFALDTRLQEIMKRLNTFPATLDLQEQGMFALGFYHQKAADRKAAKERSEARKQNEANQPETTSGNK